VRSISCADAVTIVVPITRHIAAANSKNNFRIANSSFSQTLDAGVTLPKEAVKNETHRGFHI
jgi:hypothetical protein